MGSLDYARWGCVVLVRFMILNFTAWNEVQRVNDHSRYFGDLDKRVESVS